MFNIVRKADLVWQPWKNGAGQMADVAMSVERTPAGDPVWRVSLARVVQESPFSHFPGVERGMMLIEGERLDLHVADDPVLVVRASGPGVTFSGDRPTRGAPVGGAITDLNVMVHRSVMRQRMIRWTLDGAIWLPVTPAGRTFLYVQRGQFAVSDRGHAPCAAGDMLQAQAPLQISGLAEVIEINIWPV